MNRVVRRAAIGLCAAMCVMTAASVSRAGDGWGWGYGPANWYAWSLYGRLPYRTGNVPTPPYFAIHPPVYYDGTIVRRSYGDSPFAYGSQRPVVFNTPAIATNNAPAAPKSEVIENPYYDGAEADVPVGQQTSQLPARAKLIINPYYQPPTQQVAAQ